MSREYHEETHIYDSCLHCPHRLKQMLVGCDPKDMASRIRKKYRSAYFILKNDKGLKCLFYCSANEIVKINCEKRTDKKRRYPMNVYSSTLPTKEEFTERCLFGIRHFYKTTCDIHWENGDGKDPLKNLINITSTYKRSPYARRVVEVIDVTECLTRKEKYMFRKDYHYNLHARMQKKRWLWAGIWWDKYHDQAKQVEKFQLEDGLPNASNASAPKVFEEEEYLDL